MSQHKLILIYFFRYFFEIVWKVNHVIFALFIMFILGALVISKVEGVDIVNSIYFTFITGFTIGFGDITPHTIIGKVISIIIGIVGIIFTGLIVAISVRALSKAFEHENKI